MSIRAVADAIGEAAAGLASWTPADPNDLFDLFDCLPDVLHDIRYGVDRVADRLEETALNPAVAGLVRVAARDVGHAEGNAHEARRLGGWRG